MPKWIILFASFTVVAPHLAHAQEGQRGLGPETYPGVDTGVPGDVKTDYQPGVDSVRFPNSGDYKSWGDCLAISAVEIANAKARANGAASRPKSDPATSLPFSSDGVSMPLSRADMTDKAVVGNLNPVANTPGLLQRIEAPGRLSDPTEGLKLLDGLRAGNPMILLIRDSADQKHAVVVYGYQNGKFLIDDPNFPGKANTLDFNTKTGFGPFSEGASADGLKYQEIANLAAAAPKEVLETGRIEQMTAACEALAPACADRYETPTFHIVKQDGDWKVLGETDSVPDPSKVKTKEGVSFVDTLTTAAVFVNDVLVAAAPITSNGTFDLTFNAARLEKAMKQQSFGSVPARVEVLTITKAAGLAGISRIDGWTYDALKGDDWGRPRQAPPRTTKGFDGALDGLDGPSGHP